MSKNLMRRFFLDKNCLSDHQISIRDEEHNHLAFVLRLRVGETICVCFNDGYEYISQIKSISKKETICNILSCEKSKNETSKEIVLFQDLIKQDNMELIIQKATELGVKKIIPFYSEFCQIKPDKFNIIRAQKIAKEASKQCERALIPEIVYPISFDDAVNLIKECDERIVALERVGKENINNVISLNSNSYAVMIGCEGGFSDIEKEKLLNSNIKTISLGKRILKAETASIVSLAIIENLIGELN